MVATQGEKRALRKLTVTACLYAVQVVVLVMGVAAGLHAYNLYPGMRAKYTEKQRAAEATWKHVCHGDDPSRMLVSEYTDCKGAYQDSQLNPSLRALEDVCLHLLSDVNPLSYVVPNPSSTMGYLAIRVADMFISYSFLLIILATVVALWFAWTFYIGPMSTYHQLQQIKRFSSAIPLSGPDTFHRVDLTPRMPMPQIYHLPDKTKDM